MEFRRVLFRSKRENGFVMCVMKGFGLPSPRAAVVGHREEVCILTQLRSISAGAASLCEQFRYVIGKWMVTDQIRAEQSVWMRCVAIHVSTREFICLSFIGSDASAFDPCT